VIWFFCFIAVISRFYHICVLLISSLGFKISISVKKYLALLILPTMGFLLLWIKKRYNHSCNQRNPL